MSSRVFMMLIYVVGVFSASRLCNNTYNDGDDSQCTKSRGNPSIRLGTFGARFGTCNKVSDEEYQSLFPYNSNLWELLYIVPVNWGPESLLGCEKRIYGNVVLVNATWNNCLQRRCWDDQYYAIVLIRGSSALHNPGLELIQMAMSNVASCCGKNY